MTREELEHAIRAACEIAQDDAVFVFGSQAILGQFPEAPATLRQSVEVDISPVNKPERADAIDGAIGELSPFHQAFGFYVHGAPIDETAVLPPGWRDRTVTVRDPVGTRGATGLCLEVHDLAASKLAAFRERDRDFVRTLLVERMVDQAVLLGRIGALDLRTDERDRRATWVRRTGSEL